MKKLILVFIIALLNLQLTAQGNLEVTGVTPSPQSMNFLPKLEISINFNKAVDINSFNDTTFQVWGRDRKSVV